jgi:Uncharacterized protein conserved in bacteria
MNKFKALNILLCVILIFTSLPILIYAADEPLSVVGSVKSNSGTKLNLRIDYTVTQAAGDTDAVVDATIYLEYIRLKINDERIGTLSLNNETLEFKTGRIWEEADAYHELKLLNNKFKVAHKLGEPLDLTFGATWTLGGSYSGVHVGEIKIDEKVTITSDMNTQIPTSDPTDSQPTAELPPPSDNVTDSGGIKIPNTVFKSAVELIRSGQTSANDFHMSGTITSHTGTNLTLRIEWTADQEEKSDIVKIKADVYLDYIKMLGLSARSGSIDIGGAVKEFVTPEMNVTEEVSHSDLLTTHNVTVKREWGKGIKVKLDANWRLGATYTGTKLDVVQAVGTIILSEKYNDLPDTASYEVNIIMQNPELPNGCEITSLAMVLNKLGYNVDKLTLNDKYLEIGPIGLTNYYKANVGNPRDANSFGSYSPVIFNTAEKYLADQGKTHTTYDITGHNIDEVYYQLSQGNPVIMWTTLDINTKPLVIKTWQVDGETLNWKHPLHCVVLTGYDMNNKTVTVADPNVGVVTHSMDLFELRWREMGSQAIYIK